MPAPNLTTRDQKHGYVFEVSSRATGLTAATPIKAMGRFEHEACAVHAATGIVYMTEDRVHSLFYRYIPDTPGRLQEGGRLQALAIDGHTSVMTHNWSAVPQTPLNQPLKTHWIDLDDVDPVGNDLRLRGAAKGAATFARGEGLCVADDRFAFTCTIGGPARIGQVFTYTPSPNEGTAAEKDEPGTLTLIAEADETSLLRNCDNLTMAPWGDLIVCEDTAVCHRRQSLLRLGTRGRLLLARRQNPVRQYPVPRHDACRHRTLADLTQPPTIRPRRRSRGNLSRSDSASQTRFVRHPRTHRR